MDFPSALTEALRSRNMTDEQLAVKLHVTGNAVFKWRSGSRYPRGPMRAALAELFPELQDSLRVLAATGAAA